MQIQDSNLKIRRTIKIAIPKLDMKTKEKTIERRNQK